MLKNVNNIYKCDILLSKTLSVSLHLKFKRMVHGYEHGY